MTSTLIDTGRTTGARPGPAYDDAVAGTTCRCGQELDCCHRAHCPRCGTTLGA